MKSGLTIVEMAQQIERQSKLKQDYLLDTRRLQVEPFGSQLYLHTFDDHDAHWWSHWRSTRSPIGRSAHI